MRTKSQKKLSGKLPSLGAPPDFPQHPLRIALMGVKPAEWLNESKVTDESYVQGGYSGTIEGKNHKVILRLGKNRDMTVPAGYYVHMNGDHYTIYMEGVQGIDEVESGDLKARGGEKFMENGQLYIRCGEQIYDARGTRIN